MTPDQKRAIRAAGRARTYEEGWQILRDAGIPPEPFLAIDEIEGSRMPPEPTARERRRARVQHDLVVGARKRQLRAAKIRRRNGRKMGLGGRVA